VTESQVLDAIERFKRQGVSSALKQKLGKFMRTWQLEGGGGGGGGAVASELEG
jgi:hypothetical protein